MTTKQKKKKNYVPSIFDSLESKIKKKKKFKEWCIE